MSTIFAGIPGVVIFLDDINTCHPRRENVVADILSRSTPPPAVDPNPDPSHLDLIKLLHSPLAATVSLQELQQASEQNPVLSRLHTFIHSGWPPASGLPDSLAVRRFKDELFCWNDHCIARGHCTVIPSALQTRILAMAHEGHLGIVKVKQRLWPGIDGDVEAMVRDCTACLVSGKTGPPPAPPLQPLQWHSGESDRTAFYNPQVNGGVERMNPTLKNGIRAHLAEGFQFSAELLRTLLHY